MSPTRPELTFPADVAAYLTDRYRGAGAILEYGSGGSTALAASLPGTVCFSVETDADWAGNLARWIALTHPEARTRVHLADIGPTGPWGWPAQWRWDHRHRYARYPRSVWRRTDFVHPDLVLIDGRFRVAAFATVQARIARPVTVLFDDYAGRPDYHVVERIARPVDRVGRMAVFDLTPGPVPPDLRADLARLALYPL